MTPLEIKERDPVADGSGAVWTAEEKLWATAEGEVVPDGDERAAFLLCIPGDTMPRKQARKQGLLDYKEPPPPDDPDAEAEKQAAAEEEVKAQEEALTEAIEKVKRATNVEVLTNIANDESRPEELREAASERAAELEESAEEEPEKKRAPAKNKQRKAPAKDK